MTDGSQTVSPKDRGASQVVLVLDVIGLICLLFLTTIVAPKFRAIFADLQTPLPAMTAAILSVPGFAYAVFIVASICGLIAKERSVANRTLTRNVNLIALVAIVVCLGLLVVAMFIPLTDLVTTMKK